jgi:hypothetical protein
MTTECRERDRLLRAYSAFLSDYMRSVQVLTARIGVLRRADYQSIRTGEDRARKLAEQTRLELDAHIAEHGCAEQALKVMTAT